MRSKHPSISIYNRILSTWNALSWTMAAATKKDNPGYRHGLFAEILMIRLTKTGLFGDPAKAAAEKGKLALETMINSRCRL